MDNTQNKKLHILVADDDQEIVDQVRHALFLHFDCKVDGVFNGKEAVDMLDAGGPCDLLILDILLPKLNGIEVCQYMMKDKRLKKIPVLLISILPLNSKAFHGSLKKFNELHVVKGVLEKPFSNDDLVARVKKIIGKPPH